MKKRKITINDIAKELNISKTSVSFVINGKAREKNISISLEKKVLAYIDEIGYRPNHFAQGLRTGKTKMIGMLVEDISDPFFSAIARMMEEIAYKKGYKILYSSTENDTQKAKDLIEMYRIRHVDGYIIAPPPGIESELKELTDDGFFVLLFDRTLPGLEISSVVVDNLESSYKAVKHLIHNGYKNIAMITLLSDQTQMLDRKLGYMQALDEVEKPYLLKKIAYHDKRENCIKEIQDFLIGNQETDALFFATNYLAESGLETLRLLKRRIPEDIGIVVFDDHYLFKLFTPSITVIAQPIKEIAEQVIHLMLKSISGPKVKKTIKTVVIPTSLMIRDSSLSQTKISNNSWIKRLVKNKF
ncbi:LacI family DNA-binding transcriptional regulator [Mucilaginibacter sabulilitoris]|uniref:LacI family DNA-binding transcriptional regulator n=1 Tax=Mucilaginibacter sabulilitoris TaxID=1173583 RepID=A0ABZ0TSZ3_9SPHI|nr:LacI family DNA-binding transcriptional regulator [Mucilaginibacter sabulilitoris]WPU96106.1 LacI family DNA-binding transcriptional regulator [Mucilaginibacter sabulilitoris]